jgi:hypothetical protein
LFKNMNPAVGALALALCAGAGTGAYAQDQRTNPPATPGASSPSADQKMQNGSDTGRRGQRHRRRGEGMTGTEMATARGSMAGTETEGFNWSRRYALTPLEQKRLEAMGLTREEVWGAAKAAHESGRDVDDVAQMVQRGRSFHQIAEDLNIPYTSLTRWPERWQSPEWAEAVKEGRPYWYAHSTTSGSTGSSGRMGTGEMR